MGNIRETLEADGVPIAANEDKRRDTSVGRENDSVSRRYSGQDVKLSSATDETVEIDAPLLCKLLREQDAGGTEPGEP